MIWVSITKNTINLGSESLGMISSFWSIGWASWCCRIPSQPQKALVCANKKLMWNQAEAFCKEGNALSIPWCLQYILSCQQVSTKAVPSTPGNQTTLNVHFVSRLTGQQNSSRWICSVSKYNLFVDMVYKIALNQTDKAGNASSWMITGNRKDINQQITKLDNNIWELVKNDLKFGCLNFKYRSKETIQTKSSLLISISVNSIFRALLGSVYLRIICDVFYAPLGNVYLRATLKLFYTLLGSVCITPP